ncbi:hypothetical protein C4580_01030 [Candidatus Woesearchaeota archaeon]|nr:MAG: hypothetical protein C4580_01030 [Candidatus Woesearchaeota archaeon]
MIIIVGSGKFGQAISTILRLPHKLVDVEADGTYSEQTKHSIKTAESLILCVPSAYLEQCAEMLKPIVKPKQAILSCTKGLFSGLKTPTEILSEHLSNPTATLNGPNLASEILHKNPTITTLAGERAQYWMKTLDGPNFHCIHEKDATGAQFAAAAKNIIAIGAGLIDGYFAHHACNTMGSFTGLATLDLQALYRHKHKKQLPTLSFVSDLFATSMSEESRNHAYGHSCGTALLQGKPRPLPSGTIEGLRALDLVTDYSRKHKLALPAIDALRDTLEGKHKPDTILTRSLSNQ